MEMQERQSKLEGNAQNNRLLARKYLIAIFYFTKKKSLKGSLYGVTLYFIDYPLATL